MTVDADLAVAAGLTPAPRAPTWDNPVEMKLAMGAVRMLAVAAIPAIALAWLLVGSNGALSAAIAVAIVLGMYLMSGALLSYAAKFGPSALMAAALGGFGIRLGIYAILLVLLTPVDAIHGPTLAVTAAIMIVASLVWEARMVSRAPSLFWVDADARVPGSSSQPRHSTKPLQPRNSA